MPEKELTGVEKKWVDHKLARYPRLTPEQRADLIQKFRAEWPYAGGPNLSDAELRALDLEDLIARKEDQRP